MSDEKTGNAAAWDRLVEKFYNDRDLGQSFGEWADSIGLDAPEGGR